MLTSLITFMIVPLLVIGGADLGVHLFKEALR